MKTRQHPYWVRSLCEAGKPTLSTPFQGDGLMLIHLGSWTQGKTLCERSSKVIFSFHSFEESRFTRLCQYSSNPTEASSVECSVSWTWHWVSKRTGLAAICPPPSYLHGNFINFVGWACSPYKCWLLSVNSTAASSSCPCSHRDECQKHLPSSKIQGEVRSFFRGLHE